ncbi:MAG TPA: RNA polymerase sigma factor [bacterium]|nr:RNA polymerase sigma factor [bacterium]
MASPKKTSFFGGEQALFLRLKKHKDKQAFIEAYDLYIEQIFRFIYFKVGDRDEAEDIASMVFLKCWNYIYEGNLGDYQTLKSLLYKIARNTIIDYYRKTQHRQNIPLDDIAQTTAAIDTEPNPEEQAATAFDFQKVMEEKLPQLKEEYREVIVLRFINELSIAEISSVIGKTNGNVRVMIHRALESLQQLVKEAPEEIV